MIAATAQANHLRVATRNVADFKALGVEVFNPFWEDGFARRPAEPTIEARP